MAEIRDNGEDCPFSTFIIEVWKHKHSQDFHVEITICKGSVRQKLERKSVRWGEEQCVIWETKTFWPNTIGIKTIMLMIVPIGEDRKVYVTPMISYHVNTYDRNITLQRAEFFLLDDAVDTTLLWQIPNDVANEEEALSTEPKSQLPDVKKAFSTPPLVKTIQKQILFEYPRVPPRTPALIPGDYDLMSVEYDVISECGKYKALFWVKYTHYKGPGTRPLLLETRQISDIISLKNGSTLLSGGVKFVDEAIQVGLEAYLLTEKRPQHVLREAPARGNPGKMGLDKKEVEEIELKEIKRCVMCSDTNSSGWFTAGNGTYRCGRCQGVDPRPKCERCTQAFVQEEDTMCKQCRLITPKLKSEGTGLYKYLIKKVADSRTIAAYAEPEDDEPMDKVALKKALDNCDIWDEDGNNKLMDKIFVHRRYEHGFMSTKDGRKAMLLSLKAKRTISDEIHLGMLNQAPIVPFPVLGKNKCDTMCISFAASSKTYPSFIYEFDDKSCFALPLDYTNYKCIVMDAGLINFVRKDIYETALVEVRGTEGDLHVNFKACVLKMAQEDREKGYQTDRSPIKVYDENRDHICAGDDCDICRLIKARGDYKCIDCGSRNHLGVECDEDDSSEGPPPLMDVPVITQCDEDDSSEGPPPLIETPRTTMKKLKHKARHILIAWAKEQRAWNAVFKDVLLVESKTGCSTESAVAALDLHYGNVPRACAYVKKGTVLADTLSEIHPVNMMTLEKAQAHLKEHTSDVPSSLDDKGKKEEENEKPWVSFGEKVELVEAWTGCTTNTAMSALSRNYGNVFESCKYVKSKAITKGVILDVKVEVNDVDRTEEYKAARADILFVNELTLANLSVSEKEAVCTTPKKTTKKLMNTLGCEITVIPISFSREAYDRMVVEQASLGRLIADQEQWDTQSILVYLQNDYNNVSVWLEENSFDCPGCKMRQPMDHSCSIEKLENVEDTVVKDKQEDDEKMSSKIKYTEEELRKVRDDPISMCQVVYGDSDEIFVKVPIDKVKSYGFVCTDKHIVIHVLDVNNEYGGNHEFRVAQQDELAQLKSMRDILSEKLYFAEHTEITVVVKEHGIVCARIIALTKEMCRIISYHNAPYDDDDDEIESVD